MSTERDLPMALRATYLSLHRVSEASFASYGVTADQFVLLATLSQGQALTQRELASRMSSDPSTVRAMLVLLNHSGLVKRQSHPSDARAKTVALTAAGTRKLQQLWKAGQQIRDKMLGCLGPTDAETLLELLRRVANSLAEENVARFDAISKSSSMN